MQVILDSSFKLAQVQPLYGAGRKESSGTGLHVMGTAPILETARAYGLPLRLWLLVICKWRRIVNLLYEGERNLI